MYYPLTVRDFLDRAETVYPDRVAVVDEPDQPAPSLGSLTYRDPPRSPAPRRRGLDQLGVPTGGRVAVISQNSARLLTSFFGSAAGAASWCRSTSGSASPRSTTSSATAAPTSSTPT